MEMSTSTSSHLHWNYREHPTPTYYISPLSRWLHDNQEGPHFLFNSTQDRQGRARRHIAEIADIEGKLAGSD
jgi:hypothetical protein